MWVASAFERKVNIKLGPAGQLARGVMASLASAGGKARDSADWLVNNQQKLSTTSNPLYRQRRLPEKEQLWS